MWKLTTIKRQVQNKSKKIKPQSDLNVEIFLTVHTANR